MKAAYFPRRLFLKKKTNISKKPKRYGKNVRQHHRRLEMASEHTQRRQTPLRGCHRQVCGNRHSMLHNLRKHFLTHTHIHHGQRTNPPMPLQVVLALEDRHKTRPLQQGRDALPSIGIPRPQMAVLGERNATRRGTYTRHLRIRLPVPRHPLTKSVCARPQPHRRHRRHHRLHTRHITPTTPNTHKQMPDSLAFAIICLVSCVGGLLLVRHLKKRDE